MADNLETVIRDIRRDLADVREVMGGVKAQLNSLQALQTRLTTHEILDAAVQAEHAADIRRLWWGVALTVPAFVGAAIKVVLG